jgi:fructan beta-fructosidase
MQTTSGEAKWIMIVNHGDKGPNGGSCTRYFIGDFDGKTFIPTQKAKWLDYGTDYYAAVTFSNTPNDKKIILGWMSNWQYATKVPTEIWRGAMTLPRELELVNDKNEYHLNQKMIPQFTGLTKPLFSQNQVATPFEKKEIDLSQSEVMFSFSQPTDAIISLSNTKGEVFTLTIVGNIVVTDRSNSGQTNFQESFAAKPQVMPIQDKITSVQLLLDKSSVEILLNDGKYSMTNLFFPNESYSVLKIITKDQVPLQQLKINAVSRIW